ncbi:MAG: M67 family metallopeptidase [Sphingomonas bacterium]|nr:M67 family metallopeptidase [Sphingomonas bacterium]
MEVAVVKGVVAQIVALAEESTDEICGLLFGKPDRITEIAPCRNVATNPDRRFEIDPGALIAAHRAARTGGPAIVGHYHSHPSGDPVPSPRDAEAAIDEGAIWFIVASGRVRAWRAITGGSVEQRFDEMVIVESGVEPG